MQTIGTGTFHGEDRIGSLPLRDIKRDSRDRGNLLREMHTSDIINRTFESYTHIYTYTPMFVNVWQSGREHDLWNSPIQLLAGVVWLRVVAPQSRLILPIFPANNLIPQRD